MAVVAEEIATALPVSATPEKQSLQETIEKLLSKKNLGRDQYLRGCINPQMYVSAAELAGHESLVGRFSEEEVLDAATKSSKLSVDLEARAIRPLLRSKRSTIIVRDFPYSEDVLRNEVLSHLEPKLQEYIVGIKADVCDTWFIKVKEEDEVTQKIAMWLREQEYPVGRKIQSAVKSEHLLRSVFPADAVEQGGVASADSAVDPMMASTPPPPAIAASAAGHLIPLSGLPAGDFMMPQYLTPVPLQTPGPMWPGSAGTQDLLNSSSLGFPASPPGVNTVTTRPVLRVLAQVNGGTWQPWGHNHRAPRTLRVPGPGDFGPPRPANKGNWNKASSSPEQPTKSGKGHWLKDSPQWASPEQYGGGKHSTATLRSNYYSSQWIPRSQLVKGEQVKGEVKGAEMGKVGQHMGKEATKGSSWFSDRYKGRGKGYTQWQSLGAYHEGRYPYNFSRGGGPRRSSSANKKTKGQEEKTQTQEDVRRPTEKGDIEKRSDEDEVISEALDLAAAQVAALSPKIKKVSPNKKDIDEDEQLMGRCTPVGSSTKMEKLAATCASTMSATTAPSTGYISKKLSSTVTTPSSVNTKHKTPGSSTSKKAKTLFKVSPGDNENQNNGDEFLEQHVPRASRADIERELERMSKTSEQDTKVLDSVLSREVRAQHGGIFRMPSKSTTVAAEDEDDE
ncbi:unnamed protein product [Amoebophrya sp. A25]|nr:unnamed protein product [Amoebophrya sp. A25]|eukprot:GSA25T00009224001.1